MFLSQVFANAIVRSVAKRLFSMTGQSKGKSLFDKLLKSIQNYDSKSEDFRFLLVPADARTVCTDKGGRVVDLEESVIANVGFNYALERHPLLYNRDTIKEGSDEGVIQNDRLTAPLWSPVPTACAAFKLLRGH